MLKNVFYSFLVGTGALVLSLLNIMITVPLMGQEIQSSMVLSSVVGCYGIGSTVTFYLLKQKERLRLAHTKLDSLHRELEIANARLAHKLRLDHMTGFLNRETFLNELEDHRASVKGGALLLVDVDHFKSVNDRFGHASGDAALLQISQAIRQAVRTIDMVGRIGGEEFAVFLPGADAKDMGNVSERIRAHVAAICFQPHNVDEPVSLTVSVGGAFLTSGNKTSQSLLEADENLYKAKDGGRNRVVLGASPTSFRQSAA